MQNAKLIDRSFCHPERKEHISKTIPTGEGSPCGSLFGSDFGKGALQIMAILAKSLKLQAVRNPRSLRLCISPRETFAISG